VPRSDEVNSQRDNGFLIRADAMSVRVWDGRSENGQPVATRSPFVRRSDRVGLRPLDG